MLPSAAFVITSEAFVAGARGGLDAQDMMAAINIGSGRSAVCRRKKFMKQVPPRSFGFGFPVGSVCKDIGLAIEECEALGVPACNTARHLWDLAGRQDGAQRDMTEPVRSIEAWAERGSAPPAAKP